MPPDVVAVVLAAGAGSRFGGAKLSAQLDGRPLLQHVLDTLAAAGIPQPVVVVPPGASTLGSVIDWRDARRVVNPDPARGLSSSLQVGWAAAWTVDPPPEAVLVLLGDQPRVSIDLIRRLAAAPLDPARPVLVPRYRDGDGGNPVRIERAAADLIASASGDRGLGPLIAGRPQLARWVEADGSNPDVDTVTDLERLTATRTTAT